MMIKILAVVLIGWLVGAVAQFIKNARLRLPPLWTALVGIAGALSSHLLIKQLGIEITSDIPTLFIVWVLGTLLVLVIFDKPLSRL